MKHTEYTEKPRNFSGEILAQSFLYRAKSMTPAQISNELFDLVGEQIVSVSQQSKPQIRENLFQLQNFICTLDEVIYAGVHHE